MMIFLGHPLQIPRTDNNAIIEFEYTDEGADVGDVDGIMVGVVDGKRLAVGVIEGSLDEKAAGARL